MRISTATEVRDWWYDNIVVVTHSGADIVTVKYNPHRARIRRMNRLFNNPPRPADTTSTRWR